MKIPNLPNNPEKAYLLGARHGTRDMLSLVAMALMDKCGWPLTSDDPQDRQNIHWLAMQCEYYAEEIRSRRLKKRDVKQMLKEECGVEFE